VSFCAGDRRVCAALSSYEWAHCCLFIALAASRIYGDHASDTLSMHSSACVAPPLDLPLPVLLTRPPLAPRRRDHVPVRDSAQAHGERLPPAQPLHHLGHRLGAAVRDWCVPGLWGWHGMRTGDLMRMITPFTLIRNSSWGQRRPGQPLAAEGGAIREVPGVGRAHQVRGRHPPEPPPGVCGLLSVNSQWICAPLSPASCSGACLFAWQTDKNLHTHLFSSPLSNQQVSEHSS
jgi:hypothetical protein